ncbi:MULTISPECIES: aminodeoxychorismate synthase component I [Priestia]|uniref:Aminodeoxychorismate synthase component 1 n=2 Tax=Priestia TaxID=2800373 RepID=A0AAX6NIX2_PRIAR|nr:MULTISPECIES: aminodeoxychorismate synthase component I [Priestia]AEN92014.1 Para-aminobenzoate synthase component 1 [Priestia megaterium WSH-002]MBY0064662.1 aminodeoxychorismate synthase component I [Priestia aryabhattai]MDN3360280.1 aminodeoxychorismate synthase component I [Priestia megaterium]MDU9695620.1 aminodeoxychorismate synthase component I [Priestia aryabhattai]MED5242450.1 aminodeoxychorismate synthase component I [Priestia sp. LL-8]
MQQRMTWGESISISKNQWFKKYQELSKEEPNHILLESGRGGKFQMMGLKPVAILRGEQNELHIKTDSQAIVQKGNPLHLMRDWMKKFEAEVNPDLPPFQGGAIGFISYDYIRYVETIPDLAEDSLKTPDVYFLIFDDVFVYDQEKEKLWIIVNDEADCKEQAHKRIDQYKKDWMEASAEGLSYEQIHRVAEKSEVSMSEAAFSDATTRVHEYIGQGDVFQVNLSVRQSQQLQTHPMHIYEQVRKINPSPYMSYMQTEEFHIVSCSPELLVKKAGDEISTRPIAGTRSRGKDDQEDQQLADELIHNEKERAEHVMLVDLERNDLGRVSEYGTVHVDEFMVIEKYSHVMHIVSNVKGKLARNKDFVDIVDAVFPGGTITGAPKVRTMEIIEELEPVRRGIYTGSIGWIGFNGDMELNIAIRTMIIQDGQAYVQAGAGVVIDSNPKHEYKESLKKAIALWKAKEQSENELSEGE